MLKKIFNVLWKSATAYVVAGFALIQVASVVVSNVSIQDTLGISSELFMQTLLIGIPAFLPIFLVIAYFLRSEERDSELNDNVASRTNNLVPKIAVLPFENLNKDDEGLFLVDGIVEDLISEFSMIKEVEIVSRKACFECRNENLSADEFASKWNADYLVSGSIRAIENRLRISVELSETEEGNVLWSNKYDRVKTDIFEVQDEIVKKIINQTVGNIEIKSLKRAYRKPTKNMTSYDYMLKGRALNQKYNKESNAEALKMLNLAIEADKDNPLPYSWKACTMGQAMGMGFVEQTDEWINEMFAALDFAKEKNENDWNANRLLGEVYLSLHDYPQMLKFATTSYNANPNNPSVMSIYGDALLRSNKIPEGVKVWEKLYEIDPIPFADSNSDRRTNNLFFAYFLNGQYDKCDEIFKTINEPTNRTWLLRTHSKFKNGEKLQDEVWYKKGLNEFKDLDWDNEVDRFHLNNEELQKKLIATAKAQFA